MANLNENLLLDVLPTEIIIQLLTEVDPITLLRCRLVCRYLRNIIAETASLIYAIELAITGQEDGKSSILSPIEKLEKLRNHQADWIDLRWNNEQLYPMRDGGLWEVFGNVLAQKNADQSLTFIQLPSAHRNISEREWTVKLETSKRVRDFGIDPSQDLLVLIEMPRRAIFSEECYRIHMQTMSTAAKHPLVTSSEPIAHRQAAFDPQTSFSIQISSQYLGILFHSRHDHAENEFIIWEWKTGRKILHLAGDEVQSFSFLSARHVVLSLMSLSDLPDAEVQAELLVVDFELESAEKKSYLDITHSLTFSLPHFGPSSEPLMFNVRSDPSPSWAPHSDLKVPFHIAQDAKMIIGSLWVRNRSFVDHLTLVIPHRTLLSAMMSAASASQLPWEAWGPNGTRMIKIYAPRVTFDSWACYVYGTKFIIPECSSRTQNMFTVQVYDFNQFGVKHAISQGARVSPRDLGVEPAPYLECNTSLCVTAPTVFRPGEMFRDEVRTCLPYRWIMRGIPSLRRDDYATMCSEDSIILVDSEEGPGRSYGVLSF